MPTSRPWQALVILTALALTASGCGSSGGGDTKSSAVKRPSADPPLYRQTEYDLETSWDQEVSDRHIGAYLESIWHDPASFSSKLIIDSRPSENAPTPLAAAELTRAQTNWLPSYRERSFKKVKLGHQPAVRFAYDAAGESRITYFFEHCGTSIAFRGSTAPSTYEPFSEFYGDAASKIKVVCDE